MKECYGKYNFENEDCQMCQEGADCERVPKCYGKFDEKSEYCKGHCNSIENCSGGKQEIDPIVRLEIMRKQGKITFKEFIEHSMPIISQRERNKNNPITESEPVAKIEQPPPEEKPKIGEGVQERMDWIHN